MENIDDSEITCNVNLLDQLNAVALAICGYHGITGTRNACKNMDNNNSDTSDKIHKYVLNYNHVKGRSLPHSGKQRHGASAITSDKRCDLIVWRKSSLKRATKTRHSSKAKRKKRIMLNVQVAFNWLMNNHRM